MTRLSRRAACMLLGASALTACAAPEPVIIGGGKKTPRGGIGGTGIVGTLTDFGSLMINGLRVQLERDTSIRDAFGPIDPTALAVGQTLTVEASTIQGQLSARRVQVVHPVIGTVRALSRDNTVATINGIRVTAEPGSVGAFAIGQTVAVSGTWRGEEIIASRIDPATAENPAVIAGVVEAGAGLKTAQIVGIPLILGTTASVPDAGRFVTVYGAVGTNGFEVARMDVGRFIGAAGPLTNLSVEGFLEPIADAPFYSISGLGHSFDKDAKLEPFQDGRTLFVGDYTGDFTVARGIDLPQDLRARRDYARRLAIDGVNEFGLSAR